jgi:hypothetical protein
VQLAGVFRSFRAPELHPDGGTARLDFTLATGPDSEPSCLADFTLPSVALDCLLRTVVLDGSSPDAIGVMVPTSLERIELCSAANDLALAARWPTGIQLRHRLTPDGRHECTAISPEGELLLRATGISGSIRATHDLKHGRWAS